MSRSLQSTSMGMGTAQLGEPLPNQAQHPQHGMTNCSLEKVNGNSFASEFMTMTLTTMTQYQCRRLW